jgi:hypothetical protein
MGEMTVSRAVIVNKNLTITALEIFSSNTMPCRYRSFKIFTAVK